MELSFKKKIFPLEEGLVLLISYIIDFHFQSKFYYICDYNCPMPMPIL